MKLNYKGNRESQIPVSKLDEQSKGELTKYGLMRKDYLKEYKEGFYTGLLVTGKLTEHLLAVQEQAEQRMEFLVEQMKVSEGVTEQLKKENQMLWTQKMTAISIIAEEIVLDEIVYANVIYFGTDLRKKTK